jgi:thiamine pyridinylase
VRDVTFRALVFGSAVILFLLAPACRGQDRTAPTKLKIALYNASREAFQKHIEASWNRTHPAGPGLEFVAWDCYSALPTDGLEVFELDALFLDEIVHGDFASQLSPEEIAHSDDLLPFALEGSKVDGKIYGIPRLSCAPLLFYRTDDQKLAAAVGIDDLYKEIGDTKPNEEPPAGRGLLMDLTGGTTCACLYLDALADTRKVYTVPLDMPPVAELDKDVLKHLHELAAMAGKSALEETPLGKKHQQLFSDGRGRAFVGYSECLHDLSADARKAVHVRDLPLGPSNAENLFFVDTICVSRKLTPERRKLAVELANLCASAEEVLEVLRPAKEAAPLYYFPARKSVLDDASLHKSAPLYDELSNIILHDPKAFRLGADVRKWLKDTKGTIKKDIQGSP